jgi:hypothetical protein
MLLNANAAARTDMDDARWMDRSRSIDTLEVEIFFQLNSFFYTGDPNDVQQLQSPEWHEPLVLPVFPALGPHALATSVCTAQVLGHEQALADYYKRLLERAARSNKRFDEIAYYFWLRLAVWNADEDVSIAFPWYDSLSQMGDFIDWLDTASVHVPFHDTDQGWQLDARRGGTRIHLCESDPEGDTERVNVAAPQAALAQAAKQARARAAGIVATLTEALGTDVWSHYRRGAQFGTVAWRPGGALERSEPPHCFRDQVAAWFRR